MAFESGAGMEQTAHVTIDPRSSKVVGWDKIFAIIEAEDKERKEIEAKMDQAVLDYRNSGNQSNLRIDESIVSLDSPQNDNNNVDGGIAQYKDYEVVIENERNF